MVHWYRITSTVATGSFKTSIEMQLKLIQQMYVLSTFKGVRQQLGSTDRFNGTSGRDNPAVSALASIKRSWSYLGRDHLWLSYLTDAVCRLTTSLFVWGSMVTVYLTYSQLI